MRGMPLSPHRRRCMIRAILEVCGAVSGLTLDKLLAMSGDELTAIYIDIEKALETANITEPVAGPRLEDLDTIVMPAVDDDDDD